MIMAHFASIVKLDNADTIVTKYFNDEVSEDEIFAHLSKWDDGTAKFNSEFLPDAPTVLHNNGCFYIAVNTHQRTVELIEENISERITFTP